MKKSPFLKGRIGLMSDKDIQYAIKVVARVKKKVKKKMPTFSDEEINNAMAKASEYDLKDEADAVGTTIDILLWGKPREFY